MYHVCVSVYVWVCVCEYVSIRMGWHTNKRKCQSTTESIVSTMLRVEEHQQMQNAGYAIIHIVYDRFFFFISFFHPLPSLLISKFIGCLVDSVVIVGFNAAALHFAIASRVESKRTRTKEKQLKKEKKINKKEKNWKKRKKTKPKNPISICIVAEQGNKNPSVRKWFFAFPLFRGGIYFECSFCPAVHQPFAAVLCCVFHFHFSIIIIIMFQVIVPVGLSETPRFIKAFSHFSIEILISQFLDYFWGILWNGLWTVIFLRQSALFPVCFISI